MSHITIKQRGQEPRPRRCHADASLFTCPFCSSDVCKPRQYHQIMTHIAGHKLRAVEYGDHVIYSCNIGCGKKARHFHCCQCPKTYINKATLKKHLCSSHPIACTLKPQTVSDPQQDPPSQQPTSQPQEEPPSQKPTLRPQQDPPSQQPTSQPQQDPPSQQPTSQPQEEPPSQQSTSQPQEEPPSQQPTSQPQEEPPSQQPTSQPQEEPPSQQSTSQPQEEPPSQQPTSQPQEDPPSQQSTSQPQEEPPSQQPTSQPQEDPPSQQPTSQPQQDPPSQQSTSQPQEDPPSQQPTSQPQEDPPSQQPTSRPQEDPPSQQPTSQPQEDPPSQQPTSQPQEDPPSQQPTSRPQEDPPSQQPTSRPQQDPPSQQPTSQPQEDPPSQKPTSQPQQDPPSQQPTSQPQEEPPSQQSTSQPQEDPPSQQPTSRPQEDPPSQQPTSRPQQDPPSQQPTSQPQEDPPSQQPTSQPLQLAAPPAIKRRQISVQCHLKHITIKQRGQEPRPRRCHADASLFTCPFCSSDVCKPRQYHQIMTHIAGHKLRAVEYGDHVIYSCNIGCGKRARHFHCCQCPKTYINKATLKKHLCNSHPIACTLKPQTVSDPRQEPPSQLPTSQPQQDLAFQKLTSQPQQDPHSQQPTSQPQQDLVFQKLTSQPQQDPPSQKPTSQPQQDPPSQKPTLRPQQDPPSQQPTSQPQQDPPSQKPTSQPQQEPPSQQPTSQPQQEPPSQQPTSQPQQDPPSQKPTSQAQQDPPSQKPTSQPQPPSQQPTKPLQQKNQSWIIQHITIKQRGQEPRPRRCHADASLFTCPFCSSDVCKPRQYHQIMTHIAGHKLRAVEYGDHVIYSCNIGCGKRARHFHCCQCPKTYINKATLKKHLCNSHPIACTLKPQTVSDPQQEPPSKQPTSQPQQEPPSQQPTSQPQQEPPSQQPTSQPQEDPPSQQTSHPLQLTTPPAINRRQISAQCHHRHITIKPRGQEPRPQCCQADASLFTCPFCSSDVCKPRKYKQIMAHIAGHKLRAVEYGDYVIYSCNSCGEKARHFHCCQCPQTYFNQGALRRHLYSTHPIATGTAETEPKPVDCLLQEPPLLQPAPHPVELAAQPVIAQRKQISVQCPHCRVSLNSKNLKIHIKRKHHEAMHPIASTWDTSHKVICVEMAPRSELLVTQCVSLSSVDFTCAAAPSEVLSEDMLTEME